MFVQHHWNKITAEQRPPKHRDYISFSDLGKPFIDRYLKMKGEPFSNNFDERVLRIFDAGKVMELIVLRALTIAGVLNRKQEYVEIPATDKTLKCMGFLDCTVGGFVNWQQAEETIMRHLEEYKLKLGDELIEQKAINLIHGWREEYPTGELEPMVIEVKSINSMAFWKHKNRNPDGLFLGYPHNILQNFGYMKGTGIEKGLVFYISKDDFMLEEVAVSLYDENTQQAFQKDVEIMTAYYNDNTIPPKEPEIVYNDLKENFEHNWQVLRSNYLTRIYGYKDKDELKDKNKKLLNGLNLALKHLRERIKKNKILMTEGNIITADEKKKLEKSLALIEQKIKTTDKEYIETYNLKSYI